jgi:hypothetical protein
VFLAEQQNRKEKDEVKWRLEPESNRSIRLCRPLHNRFAIQPLQICKYLSNNLQSIKKKPVLLLVISLIWSGKRGSNSRPTRWQRVALPAELFPQKEIL